MGRGSGDWTFMCFGSVAGEAQAPANISKAPASGGWMTITSCKFSGSVNYGQRAAEGRTGQTDLSTVTVTKITDASSPGLLRKALLGALDNAAVIVFLRADGNGSMNEYLRVEMRDCGIVSFDVESPDEDRCVETYSIRFGSIDIKSNLYDVKGTKISQNNIAILNQS